MNAIDSKAYIQQQSNNFITTMINPQPNTIHYPLRNEYPQQYNLPTASFSQLPPQVPTYSFAQPLNQTKIIQGPSRIIEPGQSYRPLPQSILLPPQQTYQQPHQSFIHPQYLIQPVPVIRRHPQYDLNPNFDYESANLLCEVKVVESTIYCVVCGSDYKISEKDQHVQKHIRKAHDRGINQTVLQKVEQYKKKETKPQLIVKPIVLPEEVDVHFDPNVYQVIQQTIYEDQQERTKKEAGIGQDGNTSFNIFDNNVSISHNNTININPALDVEPNPFFSKQERYEEPNYFVPDFEIPNPQKAEEEYEPQIHENTNIQQVVVEHQPIVADSYQASPVPKVSHLLEQSAVDKSHKSRNVPSYEEEPQFHEPAEHVVVHYEDKRASGKLNSKPIYEEQPVNVQPINEQQVYKSAYQEVPAQELPQHQPVINNYSQPTIHQPQVSHINQQAYQFNQQPTIHIDPQPTIFQNEPSPFIKREPIYVNLDEHTVQQRLTNSKIPKASRNLIQSQSVPNHFVNSQLPADSIQHSEPYQSVPLPTNAQPFYGKNQEVRSQYSGVLISITQPHEVRAPSVSHSKKSSINMSQFIRDHNDGTPMVFQDLKRIPNQSQW